VTVAEEMRRAAELMRKRAEAVAHGPWQWEALGDKKYPQRITNPGAILIAETFIDPGHPPAEAEYIASMHPDIALAVANLLEEGAKYYEALADGTYGEAGPAIAAELAAGEDDPGVKIARAYLEGEGADAPA
jgi:hypothetical protein